MPNPEIQKENKERKKNSHQIFQGSAGVSPCLLTGTAKPVPAEKVGCPSGTEDESESQKDSCAHAPMLAAPLPRLHGPSVSILSRAEREKLRASLTFNAEPMRAIGTAIRHAATR